MHETLTPSPPPAFPGTEHVPPCQGGARSCALGFTDTNQLATSSHSAAALCSGRYKDGVVLPKQVVQHWAGAW